MEQTYYILGSMYFISSQTDPVEKVLARIIIWYMYFVPVVSFIQ